MPGLTQDPLAPLVIPGGNADLPPTQFPTLTRISVIDLVGPNAANRQHKSLEKRSVSLGQLVNQLVANNNVIDDNYLRRDGSAQKSNGAGILADMPMNGNRLTGMAASNAVGHAVEHSQFTAEQAAVAAALALKADIASPVFTGTPHTTYPPANSNDTRIPTTQWTRDLVAGLSFAYTQRLVAAGAFSAMKYNASGTQTADFEIQVEKSSDELSRYIELGPMRHPSQQPSADFNSTLTVDRSNDFDYPGSAARQFLPSSFTYDKWVIESSPIVLGTDVTKGPNYPWPVLCASVRHDDNSPRTEAYFIITSIWHDALTDQIMVRGVMRHFDNAGTGTFISRAQGVHTIIVPVNDIEANLFTVSNQKGVANTYLRGRRTAPGQPALLRMRGERVYGGHGDNRTGFGVWFPYRTVASFPL